MTVCSKVCKQNDLSAQDFSSPTELSELKCLQQHSLIPCPRNHWDKISFQGNEFGKSVEIIGSV